MQQPRSYPLGQGHALEPHLPRSHQELSEGNAFGNSGSKMSAVRAWFCKTVGGARRFYTWLGSVYNGFQMTAG